MKVRQGFVSNSSTTSFCIYGICKNETEIKEALIEKELATQEELADGMYEYMDGYNYKRKKRNGELTEEDIDENEKKFFKEEDGYVFNQVGDYGDDYSYLGIPWQNIREDETGAQFRERIQNKMKTLFGDNVECSTHEEAWRDG